VFISRQRLSLNGIAELDLDCDLRLARALAVGDQAPVEFDMGSARVLAVGVLAPAESDMSCEPGSAREVAFRAAAPAKLNLAWEVADPDQGGRVRGQEVVLPWARSAPIPLPVIADRPLEQP
jgi:hypothetical protein